MELKIREVKYHGNSLQGNEAKKFLDCVTENKLSLPDSLGEMKIDEVKETRTVLFRSKIPCTSCRQ